VRLHHRVQGAQDFPEEVRAEVAEVAEVEVGKKFQKKEARIPWDARLL